MKVAHAVLVDLASDPEALEELRQLIMPLIAPMLAAQAREPNPWLDAKRAAEYLGISVNALHKHTSARTIPFEQDVAFGKCWFRRADLDAWRTG